MKNEKIDFAEAAQYALRLKELRRTGWLNHGIENCESVADHSFSTAIMSMIMSDHLGLDTENVIKMALLHDLAESITGDIATHEKEALGTSKIIEQERNALEKIFSNIPHNLRSEYMELFEEFEKGKSEESSLVKEIDKLDMILQARHYQEKHDKNLTEFRTAISKIKRKELLDILGG